MLNKITYISIILIAVIFLLSCSGNQETEKRNKYKNDSCYQLVTMEYKVKGGTILWRNRITAFEIQQDNRLHIYMNGVDSLQVHKDSLITFQMIY